MRRRARFALWARYLDLRIRRAGGQLDLEAPYGAELASFPVIRTEAMGEGDGVVRIRLGRGVNIGRGVSVEIWTVGSNGLDLGDGAWIGDYVRVQLRDGTISIGARSEVRDFSLIKSEGRLSLGDNVRLSYGGVVHCTEHVELNDWVGIAERVTIVDTDHTADGGDDPIYETPLLAGPVVLERNVFVAANVVITRNSHVGRNSVLAAGAVLTGGEYPSGWLIGGVPARPLKQLGTAETA